MASKISICSDASLLVGSRPIADLTEDTTEARLTSNLFEMVRDNMLRVHPWTFATKRDELSPLVIPPAYGYKYAFNAPSDMIRLISVDDPDSSTHFILEGKKILANRSSLRIRYVYRNEEVALWAPDFITAVTFNLAALIAYPIAKSDSLRQTLFQQSQYYLMIAKNANGMEIPAMQIPGDPLYNARF